MTNPTSIGARVSTALAFAFVIAGAASAPLAGQSQNVVGIQSHRGIVQSASHAVGRSRPAGHLELRHDHAARAAGPVQGPRNADARGGRAAQRRGSPAGRPPPRRPVPGRRGGLQLLLVGSRPVGRPRPRSSSTRRMAGCRHTRPRVRSAGRRSGGAATTPGRIGPSTTLPRATGLCRSGRAAYNNNNQIVQAPGYVAMLQEQIHEVRIIPLDGRPHVGQAHPALAWRLAGPMGGQHARRRDDQLPSRHQLRGLRSEPHRHRAIYVDCRTTPSATSSRSTIRPPGRAPWTGQVPWQRDDGPIFEYACHEGNYGMVHLLKGARVLEAEPRSALETGEMRPLRRARRAA